MALNWNKAEFDLHHMIMWSLDTIYRVDDFGSHSQSIERMGISCYGVTW